MVPRPQGLQQQYDSSQTQYVLGAQPPDRPQGGREDRRRLRGSLVCGPPSATHAASIRQWQACHQLSPRDRFAGSQTGRIRKLPVSGRHVSHEPLPHGLRCVVPRPCATRGSPRISQDSATGGTRESRGSQRCVAGGPVGEPSDLFRVGSLGRRATSTAATGHGPDHRVP